MNDIAKIISQLEEQGAAIGRAISALRAIDSAGPSRAVPKSSPAKAGRRKRQLSAEGRKNIIAAIKKRWAAKRAGEAAAAGRSAPGKRKVKRVISPEARKKMAEAAKKRWTTRKKEQAA